MSQNASTATSTGTSSSLVLGFDSPSDFANAASVSRIPSSSNGNGQSHRPGRHPLSAELAHTLMEVKGQSQFLLYLADQIEESLGQLTVEDDESQAAFLCKILTMYAAQLESKHRCVGETIGQTCSQVYAAVREIEGQ